MTAWKNKLYFGDNLEILRDHVADETVDLVYLDPPFNSNATYNVLFKEATGKESGAQIAAFEDTWHWGLDSEAVYEDLVREGPKKLADLIQALRAFLGQNDMMAYLVMMAARLVELHRALKPTGSLYLHCDPTASHYLKLLLDAIFGFESYLNEINWVRTNAHNFKSRCFARVTDTLLLYVRSDRFVWNPQFAPYSEEQLRRYKAEEGTGRLYKAENLTLIGTSVARQFEWRGAKPPANRVWGYSQDKLEELWKQGRILAKRDGSPRLDGLKVYLDEMRGKAVSNVWDDISRVGNTSGERLGFPTQKPEGLLERIIQASSNEGDLVLDPFCGCGTTIAVAERLHRSWIGIDVTHLAIALMRHRLHDAFGDQLSPYEVIGDPKDLESAAALAKEDPYQFEWWALSLIEARPGQDRKKGADTGIDGYIYFFDDKSGSAKKIVVQVKGGGVHSNYVRDLKGVLAREKAEIGILVTLNEPTAPMRKEAASAGFYTQEHLREKYPRLQILTIAELLEGKRPEYPRRLEATFRKAERKEKGSRGEGKRLL